MCDGRRQGVAWQGGSHRSGTAGESWGLGAGRTEPLPTMSQGAAQQGNGCAAGRFRARRRQNVLH
jgi:hypothetical protein